MITEFLNARIGVISPDDSINDDEYWACLPEGVNLLFTRYYTSTRFEPISIDMLAPYGDLDLIEDAAIALRITRPNAVLYACNSVSFLAGIDGAQKIIETIEHGANSKATTIATAQIEALTVMGVKRVAVVGCYPHAVTLGLKEYLSNGGFDVISVMSANIETEWEIGNTKPETWADLARQVDSQEAECIIIAGGGTRTIPILDALEEELGKPVLSGPTAVVWHGLRLAGIQSQVTGCGHLLANY